MTVSERAAEAAKLDERALEAIEFAIAPPHESEAEKVWVEATVGKLLAHIRTIDAETAALSARLADAERSYGSAVAMCVRWKKQRDRLRTACGYSADQIRDSVQPEYGSFHAAIVADLDAAMKATRDFSDADYDRVLHAAEVAAAHPGSAEARLARAEAALREAREETVRIRCGVWIAPNSVDSLLRWVYDIEKKLHAALADSAALAEPSEKEAACQS